MQRCRTTHHLSSPCFIRENRANKKAERFSAFLFEAISEINSAQKALYQQTNVATYPLSFRLFGRNQQDAHLL